MMAKESGRYDEVADEGEEDVVDEALGDRLACT
jgi:hypothetical protein